MNRFVRTSLALVVSLSITSLAHAQASRTWVSGVGDDVNPCSRTAPCKTYAGAISKTAAGGEISTLDPGGFGAVTITKSITISGDGTLASIFAAGTNGVVVNGAGIKVVLRNLSIHGFGTGFNAIRIINAASVVVDKVSITSFTQDGIVADVGNHTVLNSTFTGVNGVAAHTTANLNPALVTSITLENNMFASNGIAVRADGNSSIRMSNNAFYNNLTAFACGVTPGGVLASVGNNRKSNNTGGASPTCAPTVTITLQ
jgi:hypothetical protein